MTDGWVCLHRSLTEHWVFKDHAALAVWIYLLTHATHKEKKVAVAGKPITLLPGQMTCGRTQIATATGLSENQIRRVLKLLRDDSQIHQQIFNVCSLITITNWESYQENNRQNHQQTTSQPPAKPENTPEKPPAKPPTKAPTPNGSLLPVQQELGCADVVDDHQQNHRPINQQTTSQVEGDTEKTTTKQQITKQLREEGSAPPALPKIVEPSIATGVPTLEQVIETVFQFPERFFPEHHRAGRISADRLGLERAIRKAYLSMMPDEYGRWMWGKRPVVNWQQPIMCKLAEAEEEMMNRYRARRGQPI